MLRVRDLILSVAAATAVAVPCALAASLTEIPPLGADTSSEARAITPDGKYVVGQSGTGTGFIWDAVNGVRNINAAGSVLSTARGIAYRTVGGQPQLIVHGLSAGWDANAFSDDGGLTWPTRLRRTSWPQSNTAPTLPLYNSISGSSTDFFYETCWRTTELQVFLMRGQGSPPVINNAPGFTFTVDAQPWDTKNQPTGANTVMRGISETGRAVGYRRDTNAPNPRQNHIFEYQGTGTPVNYYFTALDGTTQGECWSINADGTRVFGYSPVTDGRPGNWPYVAVNPISSATGLTTAYELPTYPDVAGSTTNGVPYGASASGEWAVGHNYRGQERAVLWDLRDATPANWKVYDLTAYFGALGQLGAFTRLDRAFSVGVDTTAQDVVVSGRGITAAGTRAFVARIPLADFPLPDTGACCSFDLNTQTAGCTSKFQANCPDVSGQQRFSVNTLCVNAACPGACCNDNGTCSDFVEPGACVAPAGIFRGSSTSCATSSCAGACCQGFQYCEQVDYGACDGSFAGIGVTCEAAACPCTVGNHIWADADRDGDIDHDDFGAFQLCYTGLLGGVPAGCVCFDRDGGSDIDDDDFTAFKNCVTGPNVPFDSLNPPPGCAP